MTVFVCVYVCVSSSSSTLLYGPLLGTGLSLEMRFNTYITRLVNDSGCTFHTPFGGNYAIINLRYLLSNRNTVYQYQ